MQLLGGDVGGGVRCDAVALRELCKVLGRWERVDQAGEGGRQKGGAEAKGLHYGFFEVLTKVGGCANERLREGKGNGMPTTTTATA